MRIARRRHLAAIAAAALFTLVPASLHALAASATIKVKPAAAPAGAAVKVSGTGFGASETVDVSFDGTQKTTAATDSTGAFSGATFRIPKATALGSHTVAAHGESSGLNASKPFIVLQLVKIVSSSSTCASTFCFQPPTPTVPSGDIVKWKNASTASHTVTRCSAAACGVSGGTGAGSGPSSPTIAAGKTYSFTFVGAGTYVYYCAIHGYAAMHGTITVS